MDTKTFLDNFGHIADVPNGVKKLRGMILDLAVQGNLGTQKSSDEPAKELLESISHKKQSLIKEKKLRKTKEPLYPEESPNVNIPSSWEWTNLYTLGEIGPRNVIDDDVVAGFIPMPLISETYGVPVEHKQRKWKEIKSGFTHFIEGDVALAKITPCFQNGKSCVMRGLSNGVGAGTTELHIFRTVDDSIIPEYVLMYLKTPSFIQGGIPKMTGTAGQKRITRDYFAGNHFPLPPTEEQKRIVAKVDQLMALCDQLQTQQKQKAQTQVALNNAALDKLLNAQRPDEFNHHWQRIANNFHNLYDSIENLTKLRELVLQLAVMGKLVRQDSNDISANLLLEKIKPEKDKIIRDGKFKVIDENEPLDESSLFAIPSNWSWCRLSDIAAIARGGSPRPIKSFITDSPDGLNWIKIGDTDRNLRYIVKTEQKIKKEGLVKTRAVYPGDLVLSNSMSYGYPYILKIEGCIHDGWLVIRTPDNLIDKMYLCYLFLSTHAKISFDRAAAGGVVQNLNADKVRVLAVPLPPVEEQKRIVAKVDQLMALCDQLETKLKQTHTTSESLVEATVKSLVA